MKLITCFGFDDGDIHSFNTYIFESEPGRYIFYRFGIIEKWINSMSIFEKNGSSFADYALTVVTDIDIDYIKNNISLELLPNQIEIGAPAGNSLDEDILKYYVKKYLIQKRKDKIQKIILRNGTDRKVGD